MIIIIGASSYVGRMIYDYFSKKNMAIVGTYYSSPTPEMVYFDLGQPDLNNLKIPLDKATYAFIVSMITDMDACKRDQERSNKINIEGIKNLIGQLFERGIVPIFISSDYVFKGDKGNYSELDKKNATLVYGRQKMMIEDFLLKTDKPFMIARLGKVFGLTPDDGTILTTWTNQLKNNDTIRCATDQIFSPTYVSDIVRALDVSIQKELRGCYNIASTETFSRFQLARMVKSQLGIRTGKIIPCSIRDFDFLDPRPLNTSLNPNKFIKATNFKFTSIQECLNTLKGTIQKK